MPGIIVHCLVCNEERFVWYAINSVLPYVDKLLVWDTGSTDKTRETLSTIKSPKISFREVGAVDAISYTRVRQQMLESTPDEFSWLMILDGDEVWPRSSIETATGYVRSHPLMESVVVQTHNLVGDIYHKSSASAGRYQLAGQTGHLNLRFINLKTIPGLYTAKPHGQHGYFDGQGRLIQDRDPKKVIYLPIYYAHATHLVRSSADAVVMKRPGKYKCELGQAISPRYIPEIFFAKHPAIVADVTQSAILSFWLAATILTPLHWLKRLLLPVGHGY